MLRPYKMHKFAYCTDRKDLFHRAEFESFKHWEYPWLIKYGEFRPGSRILDCGCGDGLYLKIIRELCKDSVVGFDLNLDSLKLAQRFTDKGSVPLASGNICRLPFRDGSFIKIFSTEVLEHIPDDLCALREIYRVLKPGGIVILTVPNHNYPLLWDPLNWFLERFTGRHIQSGFWAGIWNMHLRLYYPGQIEATVKKAGFRVLFTEPLTHYCVPFNHIALYALKKILNSGVLPEAMSNTADKFLAHENKQSGLIMSGYRLLALLDKLNDIFPKYKSSAAILVKAVKE